MSDPFRVIAIIAAFNEGDIISCVIGHLVKSGIDVYLIDNHSTDDTVDQARQWLGQGLIHIESFPNRQPDRDSPETFDWTAILRRKEELARELQANWFIHHDADEIREGPWPGLSLKEAIQRVDLLGYNCIDFRAFNFPPIDNGFRQGYDPAVYFTFYESVGEFDLVQLKCWKATGTAVSLVCSAGHDAQFPGRLIFPIQFLLRHYPVRTQEHGIKKVFSERKERFLERERSQGWHIQYDQIKDKSHGFLRKPEDLSPFDLDRVRLELMLPDNAVRDLPNLDSRVVDLGQRLEEQSEAKPSFCESAAPTKSLRKKRRKRSPYADDARLLRFCYVPTITGEALILRCRPSKVVGDEAGKRDVKLHFRWFDDAGKALIWESEEINVEPHDERWLPFVTKLPLMPVASKHVRFEIVAERGEERVPVALGFLFKARERHSKRAEVMALSVPRPPSLSPMLASLMKDPSKSDCLVRTLELGTDQYSSIATIDLTQKALTDIRSLLFLDWVGFGTRLAGFRAGRARLGLASQIAIPRADGGKCHAFGLLNNGEPCRFEIHRGSH